MIALAIVAEAAEAAQVKLVAEPPRLVVGQSGTIHLQVAFSGGAGAGVDTGRPPPIQVGPGLRISFLGQANQFQSINGRITRMFDLQYRVTAVETGTWEVGPVELVLQDGSKITAPAIALDVGERPASPDDEKFQIEADFLSPLAWEGEVVLYRFRFVSRVPGAGVRWTMPDFQGLRQPQHGAPSQTQYRVDDPEGPILVQEGIVPLVAVGTGNRDQPPATAIVQIPIGPTDLFGLRRVREQSYPTERALLEVRPLPAPPTDLAASQGSAGAFSGLVGDFTVEAEVDALGGRVAVGQSVPWRLVISGTGALEGITLPPYAASGASIYESDAEIVARVDGERYAAIGTWERVIVPTEVGTLDLPDLSLVTFSPTEGRYVTHAIDLPALTVVEGREGDGTVRSFAVAGDEPQDPVAVELRPIYTWGRATAPRLGAALPPLLAVAAVPGALVLGADVLRWAARRRRERAEANARPPSATDVLGRLPDDPDERLAVLDTALRLAEAKSLVVRLDRDPRILELRRRLGRVRFGGGPPDPTLEDDIRRLVEAIDREAGA